MIVTENQLDEWVRGNALAAQGVVVELVWRLVAASSPQPKERRFPLSDSIGQPGPDGELNVDFGAEPFVPVGRSFWEVGTGEKPGTKATSDYKARTRATPDQVRQESTFLFVTPHSGRRGWGQPVQTKWLNKRRALNEWRDVRVIDGTKLVDWLRQFPSVELWLAQAMRLPTKQVDTPEQRWKVLRSIGEPPPLVPDVFLGNRSAACAKLKDIFAGNALQVKLETHYTDQVVDFVSAYVAGMPDDDRADALGRCIVIGSEEAWNAITSMKERHVLVADHSLNLNGELGTKLIQQARRAGHAVVFGGAPGGIPDPSRVPLPLPKPHDIKAALQKAGYAEERARNLAQKSDGNVGSLLRCLQNLALLPEWADGSSASELAIAAILGSWDEGVEADRAVVEGLSGKKSYGEWIGTMREIAVRPGTPLTHRDGAWQFVARYEGWYALGPKVFDDVLGRLQTEAMTVLSEKDPKFDLPPDQHYMSNIRGRVPQHSHRLREGIAESLALLGSHPGALTSCTHGRPETVARSTVRAILKDADWVLWASLNDVLPLLAEAAPSEFLDAIENATNACPCPFDQVFAQEGHGILGGNYMTGLLWALETLAWDGEYLGRVVMCLGNLGTRDPGGQWTNRPLHSLRDILLPWFPQTCAPIARRGAAVRSLLDELPDVGWKLLLNLLPESHSSSSGTRRPAWRAMIPDDWSTGVTVKDYWDQTTVYASLAVDAAKTDLARLSTLVERLDDLPPPAHEQVLAHLGSETVVGISESERARLWTALIDLVVRHRKFSRAEWAMKPEQVNKISAVAALLAPQSPSYRHRRLFSERDMDLYEDHGNYEEQCKVLDTRRVAAIQDVLAAGGVSEVIQFAMGVESVWRAGIAFGSISSVETDGLILPGLLSTDMPSQAQFSGGFVWGRLRKEGTGWVDKIDTSQWTPEQIGQFLAYLPFTPDTWARAAQLLGVEEKHYWSKANANPFDSDLGLEHATLMLVKHGRPRAAVHLLSGMLHKKQRFDCATAVQALLAAVDSESEPHAVHEYEFGAVIRSIQADSAARQEDICRVEWAYLPLLSRLHDASPIALEQEMARNPAAFCRVLRMVYRGNADRPESEAPTSEVKRVAMNAFQLLHEWRTPPGHRDDGPYDGGALTTWLAAVKNECEATGHLAAAMSTLGHVLVYAPPDPDGLFIHRASAAVLNAKDAENMRDGFGIEVFNSRGVHGFTGGKDERALATKYRSQAEELELAGFPRLATTFRELAQQYDHDADRQTSRSPFE